MTATETTTTTTPFTLVFEGLPPTLLASLIEEVKNAKFPVFAGFSHVEVLRHPVGLVFRLEQGKAGYSFCRSVGSANDVETFRHFLQDPIQTLYMPIAYEVKSASEDVVQGILEKYQRYGAAHAAKIDWIWYESRAGKHLLIMRIPKEIVRGMMYREGGVLSTQVRGPVSAIRQLPVLAKIVPEDAKDGEVMHRAFVTPYTGAEQYEQCVAIHDAAFREVVGAGPMGISIGPVAAWIP